LDLTENFTHRRTYEPGGTMTNVHPAEVVTTAAAAAILVGYHIRLDREI